MDGPTPIKVRTTRICLSVLFKKTHKKPRTQDMKVGEVPVRGIEEVQSSGRYDHVLFYEYEILMNKIQLL